MKKHSLSALAAAGLLAGGLSVTSASAADLGGNCCADLEERIAELEATTARKGNRKVSLTVSGWVSQNITWWDDGVEDNVYVHDSGTTLGSNVKFTGQATIVPGWTAGYVLHMELMGSDSLTMNESQANGPALYNAIGTGGGYNGVQTLQSYWFIKSESLGKVSVGLQSQASDNAAILVDGSGSLVPANWVAFDYRAFGSGTLGTILGAASCGTMGGAVGDCNGLTQNAVRYDTPTFAGFSASASWGADDFWDVAIRYAGEFAGFKLAAAAAYNEVNDPNYNNLGVGSPLNIGPTDADYFQAGVYLQHIGTGLFGLVNYGDFEDNNTGVEQETWYGKVGIRQRWTPLGHTVLYGEYEHVNDAYSGIGQFELWGVGAVQEIDNAAMSVWIKYRDIEADDGPGTDTEFQLFQFGGLINF